MTTIGKYGILSAGTLAILLVFGGYRQRAEAQNAGAANGQDQPADPFPEQYPDAAADGNLAPENATPAAPKSAAAQPAPSYSDQTSPSQPSGQPTYTGNSNPALAQTSVPPPPLPVYTQPPCPGPNYMWTPGYWYWGPAGYYWVPGAWVMAPWVGALWTPGYWGWSGVVFRFYPGYWAPYIGFYGGINYGWGYPGRGYFGGYWHRGAFFYNRAVTRVNITIVHNVYHLGITYRGSRNRVSYNGGRGGLTFRPIARERIAVRDRRILALPAQRRHMWEAASDHRQFVQANHGRPLTLVASKPLPTAYRRPAERAPVARSSNHARYDRRAQSAPRRTSRSSSEGQRFFPRAGPSSASNPVDSRNPSADRANRKLVHRHDRGLVHSRDFNTDRYGGNHARIH